MPDFYEYILSLDDKEKTIKNPYVEELMNIVSSCENRETAMEKLEGKRNSLIETYCFSIPFKEVLNIIKEYSPILELGAGTGYYSYCLRQSGADIEAYDLYSPDYEDQFDFLGTNHWFEETWIMVHQGGEDIVRAFSESSLFLCWPPPESKMAFNALKAFESVNGKYLIYIGDPVSSADESFFRELEKNTLIKDMKLPAWPWINEKLMIYKIGS